MPSIQNLQLFLLSPAFVVFRQAMALMWVTHLWQCGNLSAVRVQLLCHRYIAPDIPSCQPGIPSCQPPFPRIALRLSLVVNPILAHFFFVVYNFICHQKNGGTSHEQLQYRVSHPAFTPLVPTLRPDAVYPQWCEAVASPAHIVWSVQPAIQWLATVVLWDENTLMHASRYFPLCTKLGNSADCREGLMWGVSDLLPAISLSSSFTTVSCRCSCAAPENKSTPARESNWKIPCQLLHCCTVFCKCTTLYNRGRGAVALENPLSPSTRDSGDRDRASRARLTPIQPSKEVRVNLVSATQQLTLFFSIATVLRLSTM